MSSPRTPRKNLKLDGGGDKRLHECEDAFSLELMSYAKGVAYSEHASEVSDTHVNQGLTILYSKKRRTWRRELLAVVGGAILGMSPPGIITEVAKYNTTHNMDVGLLGAWMIAGVVGLSIIFAGQIIDR